MELSEWFLCFSVGVYFLRAKSYEHRDMVLLLKEMLVLEAKDKEFLLDNISKVTNGREYSTNLQGTACNSLLIGNWVCHPEHY